MSHATQRAELLAAIGREQPLAVQAAAALELGELEARAGDLGEALAHLDTARRVFAELGEGRRALQAEGSLAHALALRGDHERAAALLGQALAHAPADDGELIAGLELRAGDAAARAGQTDAALGHWERARAHFERHRDGAALAHLFVGMARLEVERGEVGRGARLAARAREEAEAAGDPVAVGAALAAVADATLRAGDTTGADRLAREAARILEDAGAHRTLAEVCLLYGSLVGERGGAAAAPWLARAHTLFSEQRATRDMTRAREALRRFGRRATDRVGEVATAARQAELARARRTVAEHAVTGDRAQVAAGLDELRHAEEGLHGAVDVLVADQEGMHTLLDLLRGLAAEPADAARLPQAIARAAAQLTGAERAVVALLDEHDRPVKSGAVRMPDGDLGWLTPAAEASRARGAPAFVGSAGIVAPLRRGESLRGAVYCDKGITGGRFVRRDLELLVALAGQATVILDNGRAAEALRVEARARSATLEAISDGVIAVGPTGAVTSWNAAAAHLVGRPGSPPPLTLDPWPELGELAASPIDVEGRPLVLPGGSCLAGTRVVLGDAGQPALRVIVLLEMRRAALLASRVSTAAAPGTFADVLGANPLLGRLLKLAAGAAETMAPVLVSGEPGTGKRLLAQAIHTGSPRASGACVTVDCSSLPRDTVEAELFGIPGRPGKLELADGGTVILVEIAQLPAAAQTRMARFLADGTIGRPAPWPEVRLDVRLVATTSRDLPARFHRELRERLRAVHIELPPLRERSEDIPLLIERFLERLARRLGKAIGSVSPEVQEALTAYPWPGNIRELEQVLEAEAQMAPADRDMLFEVPAMLLPGSSLPADNARGLRSIVETEHQLLLAALKQHRGNVPRVARALGVSKGTVYNMMRKFRVDPQVFRVS